jgi:undecaprenyl pyrophosphate synthase
VNAVADLLDRVRVARIRRVLRDGERPRRLGLVLDCSDLRASSREPLDTTTGYRVAAGLVGNVLRWCEEWEIAHLSVHVITAGVLRRGQGAQVGYARGLVEAVITETVLGQGQRWRLEVAGDLSRLPASTTSAVRLAVGRTRGRESDLTVSLGHPDQRPDALLTAADLVLTPPTQPGLTERDLAEALLDWSRTEVSRAG